MLSLSCTSNKAIEAGPLAPPTIVGRLPRGWGMSPSYPFIPPSICVCLCAGNFVLCARQIAPYYVRQAYVCGSCVSVCDCGACVQTFGVGPVGVCASTLRRAIIHTHAPTLYLWLYHPTTAATTLEADTNTAVGIYILRPAYVQICECEWVMGVWVLMVLVLVGIFPKWLDIQCATQLIRFDLSNYFWNYCKVLERYLSSPINGGSQRGSLPCDYKDPFNPFSCKLQCSCSPSKLLPLKKSPLFYIFITTFILPP